MEQYQKIVLEAPDGMHYTASQGKNGELIVRLVPYVPGISQDSVIGSQSNHVQEPTDKSKYFTQITAEDRKKVKEWLKWSGYESEDDPEWYMREMKKFRNRVREAIAKVNYDYWIATLEPSVENGKIYYAEDQEVGVGFTPNQYFDMAKKYAPERGSRMALTHELLIWYALRIARGWWSEYDVLDMCPRIGNFKNAPDASHSMEKTNARFCGGYYDGQGNTVKIVYNEDSYAVLGNDFCDSWVKKSVVSVSKWDFSDIRVINGAGVLVLTMS